MATRKERVELEIIVNGKKGSFTFGKLIGTAKKLNQQLKNLDPTTQEFIDKSEELKKVRTEIARINAETRGVRKSMEELNFLGLKIPRSFGGIAAALGGAFAAVGFKEVIGGILRVGVSLENTEQKAKTVFGKYKTLVEDFAQTNATAMGLTRREYVAAAAAAGDLLVPMGFGRAEAAKYASELVDLSGALAEWSDGRYDSAEVSEILTKALLGEREQLKSLGISIQEHDVKTRLAEKGQAKLTGTALQQAKAMATLELITEKSADAQQAFATNAASTERALARMQAGFKSIGEQISRRLIPGLSKVVGFVSRLIAPTDKASAATAELQGQFNTEIGVLKNANLSQDERRELIEKINKKYADYLPNLISEKDSIEDITEAQRLANDQFVKRIELLAAQELLTEIATRKAQAQLERRKLLDEQERRRVEHEAVKDAALNTRTDKIAEAAKNRASTIAIAYTLATAAVEKNAKEILELQKELDEATASLIDKGGTPPSPAEQEDPEPKKKKKKTAEELERERKEREKRRKERLKAQQEQIKAVEVQAQRLEAVQTVLFNREEIKEKEYQERIKQIRLAAYAEQLELLEGFRKGQGDESLQELQIKVKVSELEKTEPKDIDPFSFFYGFTPEQAQRALDFHKKQIELGLLDEEILLNTKLNDAMLAEEAHADERLRLQREYDLQLLELRRDGFDQRLELLRKANQTESEEYKNLLLEKLELDKQINETNRANREETDELDRQRFDNLLSNAGNAFSDVADLMQEDYRRHKAFLEGKYQDQVRTGQLTQKQADKRLQQDLQQRQKGLAISKAFQKAEIGIKLAAEIQGIWKNANSNWLNELIPGWGPIYAFAEAAFATRRAQQQVQKIDAQRFSGSGRVKFPAKTSGRITGPSHKNGGVRFTAPGDFQGEAEGGEIILNKWHQQLLGGDETFRKVGVPLFHDGGVVPLPNPSTTPSSSLVNQRTDSSLVDASGSLEVLKNSIDAMHATMRRWPTRLKADVVYSEIQEKGETLSQIESIANG